MIEHHYVVVYNRDTGHWYLNEEDLGMFTNGHIYDTSLGKFRHATDDDEAEDNAAWGWLSSAIRNLSYETEKL